MNKSVGKLIDEKVKEGKRVYLLDEGGKRKEGWDWLKGDVVVLVGAFGEGPFYGSYFHHEKVSIYREPLNTWNVVGEVIASKERLEGIL